MTLNAALPPTAEVCDTGWVSIARTVRFAPLLKYGPLTASEAATLYKP